MSDVKRESITIWSQGVRLAGDIYKPGDLRVAEKLPGILMVPGWGGSKKNLEKTRTKQVSVSVLGNNHKITTHTHRFKLIQMEPVSDRAKALTLKIAIYDGEEPVSSIETVTFASTSTNLDDRQQSVMLTLQDQQFDKNKRYRLALKDANTDFELQSQDVTIDRAITDDFDF